MARRGLTREQREDQRRRIAAMRRADPDLASLPEKNRREIELLMLTADEPVGAAAIDPSEAERVETSSPPAGGHGAGIVKDRTMFERLLHEWPGTEVRELAPWEMDGTRRRRGTREPKPWPRGLLLLVLTEMT